MNAPERVTQASTDTPRYLAIQPGTTPSYWQPKPANGHATVLLAGSQTVSGNVSMGTQTIAPGCFVREHAHAENEELIFVLSGQGLVVAEDREHPMVPGALFYFGPNARHKFVNTGAEPLTFAWTMLPCGLEDFFAAIGRPRQEGEPAPAPFERPADVKAIELGTVFADIDKLKAGGK